MIKIMFILLLFTASCTNMSYDKTEEIIEDVEDHDSSNEIAFYAPVETNPANTNYKPYFEGQTRISGIKTEEAYKVKLFSEGLDSPWGIDILPDGRLIVSEKSGSIRIINMDGSVTDKIFVTNKIETSGQGGLLDISVSPNFIDDQLIYFSLSEKTNQGSLTAVAKAHLSLESLTVTQFEIIYRAVPYFSGNNHYGSRIVFDQDGNLFVSTGERQSLQTRQNAQSLNNGHGKILHIDVKGNALTSNPYFNDTGAHQEIFSLGHRNVQGLAIHPITHELWANEMGPQGGDELNLIESAKNYGWPIISYGEEYSGEPVGEGLVFKEGFEQAVYYWDPVIAPSGMVFYTSNVIKEWENNLFISALKGQHITRLLIENNRVIGEERIADNLNERFRDICVGKDGALYTITDSGLIYRIGK